MDVVPLDVVADKTELVVLVREKHFQIAFLVEIDRVSIETKNLVRYPELKINHKLTYCEQI